MYKSRRRKLRKYLERFEITSRNFKEYLKKEKRKISNKFF